MQTLLFLALFGLFLIFFTLQLPRFQTILVHKATEWVSQKLGMPVSIDRVEIKWLDKVSFKGVLVKDLHQREMIKVDEIFVDCATNFSMTFFEPQLAKPFASLPSFTYYKPAFHFNFNNNLDYVMLRHPNVMLVREKDNDLNIDKFIDKIDSLTSKPRDPRIKGEHNTPFTIDEAAIENGIFTMVEPTEKRFPEKEFDQYNFTFNKVYGNVKKFMVLGDTIACQIKNLRGIDYRSNFQIKQLNTELLHSRQLLIFDKLYAKINNSIIRDFVGMYFNEPHDMSDFNKKVLMRANFAMCEIDAQDLARFAPSLYAYKDIYKLNGKFNGIVNDFKVNDFDLKFGKDSYFKGVIAFKNLPDLRKSVMDFNLSPSQIVATDTRQYVGDSLYKRNVEQFGLVNFNGTFKGLYDNFTTNATVESSNLGKVFGTLSMKIDHKNSARTSYSGNISTENLDIGKLSESPNLAQKLSMSGTIEGTGLSIKDAFLGFNGSVKHVGVDGYDYKNILVDGKMNQSIFSGRVSVKDSNLVFDLSGIVNFSKALNEFNLKGNVAHANLRALGYTENDVKLKSQIDVNFKGNKLDNLLGEAKLLNTVMSYEKKRLGIDSVFITSSLTDSLRKIKIVSEFLNAEVSGNFTPSLAIKDVKRLANEYKLYFVSKESDRLGYYSLHPNMVQKDKYDVDYKVLFKKSEPLFAYFYPPIYISQGTELGGKLNIRNTSEVSLAGKIDTIRYNKFAFYACDVDLNSSKEANSPKVLTSFIFNSEVQKLRDMSPTEGLAISGSWGDDQAIDFDAKIRQQNSTNKAQLFGKLFFRKEGIDLAFRNTKLNLLGSTWALEKNNLINIQNDDICFQDMVFTDQKQRISLDGTLSQDSTKMALVNVTNFDLQSLKPITNLALKGVLNGHLTLGNIYHNMLITTKLGIENLAYKNILIGNIAGEALWDKVEEKLKINSNVVRLNNEIFRVSGNYDPQNSKNSLNLNAELKQTNLEIFETFVDDIFSNVGGFATGLLHIGGMPQDPIVRGAIDFDKGVLRVKSINSFLYFDDGMKFNEEGFIVNDGFKLRDAEKNGNIATLQGGIYNGGNSNFMVNLSAYMKGRDGFKIMNTDLKDNENFYGVGMTTGDLKIAGPFSNIDISANLTSKKGTKITILTDNTETLSADEKEILFLTKIDETTKKKGRVLQDSTQNTIDLSGIKMHFNFTITPDAECEVILDRNTKDQLNAFGNGRIAIDYDSRGGFTMTGPYTIKNGIYNFSFQGISSLRKFNVQDGSNIQWLGDPKDADVNLKAIYTSNVALTGISGIQANSANSSELAARSAVNVIINLKNKLMKPDIAFDLKIDPKQVPLQYQVLVQGFEQRLREDEQVMNKNIFFLVVTNRFFPEDNLSDAVNMQLVYDNVGGIVSGKIGELASKLDPNLEIGVQFSSAKQNILDNVRLNLKYKLNDRLRFGVNSTFANAQDLSNSATANNQLYYGGEIEYNLTQDGKWQMKAYSRYAPSSYYALSATSNFVVSGVSLQYTHNFNSFFSKKRNFLLLDNQTPKPIGVPVSQR